MVTSWIKNREFGLGLLIVVVTGVTTSIDASFMSLENIRDILTRAAAPTIVTCGVMLVVLTGEIDISVGSLLALLAACMGVMLSQDYFAWPLGVGVLATLVFGTLIGAATGALVAYGRVPSIVATLATLGILRGAAILVRGGEDIGGLPPVLSAMSKSGWGGLTLGCWTALIVVLATWFLIRFTPLGVRLYAIGSNSNAADMLGLQQRKLKLFVFAYVGFLTAVAAVVDVPRLPKIEASLGVGFELLVVTCVVVGGVSITGGRGRLWGVVLAVLLLTIVRPALTFLDVGESAEKWTRAIQGAFILAAVVVDHFTRLATGIGQGIAKAKRQASSK